MPGRATNPIRYAVVGAGHISQVAMLPGFASAGNAQLAAIVSGDSAKRDGLARRYGVRAVDYEDYETLLEGGDIDAVYLAVPNHLHCTYAVRAAERGVHVLCEKPMAIDEEECERMIRAADRGGVHLMVAYRLHLEPAHLAAVEHARSGVLGRPRHFTSVFSIDVPKGNIRLAPPAVGGGPVYDLGVYCINAARYLFRDEPVSVTAAASAVNDRRFAECPETVAMTLTFPGGRVASMLVSFGADRISSLTLTGNEGHLTLDNAYEYAHPLRYRMAAGGRQTEREFQQHDQFGAQLVYFSNCIRSGRPPEPDGYDGMADVHIVRAAHRAIESGRTVPLLPVAQTTRPSGNQAISRPAIEPPAEL